MPFKQNQFDFPESEKPRDNEASTGSFPSGEPTPLLECLQFTMDRLREFGPSDILDYDQSLERLLNDPEPGKLFSASGRYGAMNNVISHLSRNPSPDMLVKGELALNHCLSFEPDIGLRCALVKNLTKINPAVVGFSILKEAIFSAVDADSIGFCPQVALAGVEAVNQLSGKPRWSGSALAAHFEKDFFQIFAQVLEENAGFTPMGEVASACGFFLADVKSSRFSDKVKDIIGTGRASGQVLDRAIRSADGLALNLRDHAHEIVKFLYHPEPSTVKAARDVLVYFDRSFLNRYTGSSSRELEALKADCISKYGVSTGAWQVASDGPNEGFFEWHPNPR